jgi:dihydrofolate reductase
MAKLIAISAIGKNYEIGKNNDLCFKVREDLDFFKVTTRNHFCLMGYKTFLSMPLGEKYIKNRPFIVLTKKKELEIFKTRPELKPLIKTFSSIDDFLAFAKTIKEDIFVIGGGFVYKEMIAFCDELILTEFNETDKDADVFFPKFDKNDYKAVDITPDDVDYKRVRYIKK